MPTDKNTTDRILGIDPGLNITGYGVIEVHTDKLGKKVPNLIEAGVVRTTAKKSLTFRVAEIHAGIAEVIESCHPESLAIEELYSHYARPRTAILMGHARGVICLAAAQRDVPVKHYGATRIKKMLTGNGHAPKSQMQTAIQREFHLNELPEPADVADALAVALCHLHLRDVPNLDITKTTDARSA